MNLAWILFLAYIAGTTYLGWLGYKKTKNFGSFAIGSGDLYPIVVGITLASSVASAATFIINPGFIYVHGLAAFMHLGVSVAAGFILMLIALSFRFRRLGEDNKALTMPHWISKRYASREFGIFFSVVNLFSLAFVVLIVGGLSIVMQQLLGVSNIVALAIILVFVTGYVFLGGTYAHVYTNTLQGSLMLIVTIVIISSGIPLFFQGETGFFGQIAAQNINLIKWVNPESNLFNDIFSIYICGFIIGAALVCQPHILTKALYVKSDEAVRKYLIYGIIALILFFLLPFAGFYTLLTVSPDQLIDPVTNVFRQDLVMTVYVKNAFPGWLFTLIGVVLLAAGMSTLDGILVSLSTITANDLVLNIITLYQKKELSDDARLAIAYKFSHIVLIIVAGAAFLICLDPPKLLGIFGQVGVYGMVVAAAPPLLAGVWFKRPSLKLAWCVSVMGLAIHFFLYFAGPIFFQDSRLTFANPGVTASIALIFSIITGVGGAWLLTRKDVIAHQGNYRNCKGKDKVR